MTPEQKSILAAEILGWRKREGWFSRWSAPDGNQWLCPPDFHTDANASLLLVEWMAKPENGEWVFNAWCYPRVETSTAYFASNGVTHAENANTLPLAVLGAFLKANGKEIETYA